MKNLLVLAVATLFATTASAAEMKWNGSVGWRYTSTTNNDGLGTTTTVTGAGSKDTSKQMSRMHQMRGNLGVMGGWENVEVGFGVRSGGTTVTNDDFAAVANSTDLGIGIEQAWFRYVRDIGSLDLAVTIGRQKNALITDSAWETLLDNDMRFDGFGWNFKFGMFGLNAAQYILGAINQGAAGTSSYSYTDATSAVATTNSKFQAVYAFQPHMTWKFSDEVEALLAVAYYKWNYVGRTNQIGGGLNASTDWNTSAINNSTFKMDNKAQWDVLASISLPYSLHFTADWVKADKAQYTTTTVTNYTSATQPEVGSTALTLGLTYGKLRKAQDFTVGYAYGSKGIGSVINAFTNEKFLADNKGHTVTVGYALADNFHLGLRAQWLEEKERIDARASTTAAAGAGSTYASTFANQKMKQSFWELSAGVAF